LGHNNLGARLKVEGPAVIPKPYAKLQLCHCEPATSSAESERSDVTIYHIEPTLARRDLNMLLLPVLLLAFLSTAASGPTRSGPGIASHSCAITFINSSFLNATWYYFKSLQIFLHFFGQGWNHIKQVANHTIVGLLEYGSIRILIDRHNQL
jgi:hypothetical protein